MRIPTSSLLPIVVLTTGSLISLACASPFVVTRELAGAERHRRAIENGPESPIAVQERISAPVVHGDVAQISADETNTMSDTSLTPIAQSRLSQILRRMRRSSRPQHSSADQKKLCKCVDLSDVLKGTSPLSRIFVDIYNFVNCARGSLTDLTEIDWSAQGDEPSDDNAPGANQNLAKKLSNILNPIIGLFQLALSVGPAEGDDSDMQSLPAPSSEIDISVDNVRGGISPLIDMVEQMMSDDASAAIIAGLEDQIGKFSAEDIEKIASRASDDRCKRLIRRKLEIIRSFPALLRKILDGVAALTNVLKDIQSSVDNPDSLCEKLKGHPIISVIKHIGDLWDPDSSKKSHSSLTIGEFK
ncbi:uncharacterized protein LOC107039934 [Diachasma alloeum]|uniref:uncharacterized protein LOC107039934 n=1 Tax=Diachasma alloeum TaxID=454923 RepID=UPI0007383736|nr:uncharacterized protein LOC107039934 [Diachasma alloeum]